MNTAVAVVAALLSAMSFGVASVVQQQAASEVPARESLRLRLVLDLARRPKWLTGMALVISSYALLGLALAFGPLVLVQPLAATDLLFALPLLSWRRRMPLNAQGGGRDRLHGRRCGRVPDRAAVCPRGPLIDTLEPMGAVLIGVAVFGEQLASSTWALAVQTLGAATAVAGIVLLDRSPLGRS